MKNFYTKPYLQIICFEIGDFVATLSGIENINGIEDGGGIEQ